MTSPTIPQIRSRMDAGHMELIETIEAGGDLTRCRRGWLMRLETLLRWECVIVRDQQHHVTDKGREAMRATKRSCGSST